MQENSTRWDNGDMVIVEKTYSRTKEILRSISTALLMVIGFFAILFHVVHRISDPSNFLGTGIAHADVPYSSAGDSGGGDGGASGGDSAGSAGDSGCGGDGGGGGCG